jgi:hypothetical protein
MGVNEGKPDRATRIVIGTALMVLGGSGLMGTPAGVFAVLAGLVALVTGLVGYCPLYTRFGWTTVTTRDHLDLPTSP